MKTTILNHPMCQIVHDKENNCYSLFITMKDGHKVMQQPYPGDQRGLVGAMTLAIDVLAGKVLLAGLIEREKGNFEEPETILLGQTKLLKS